MTGFYFAAESSWSPYVVLVLALAAVAANRLVRPKRPNDGLNHIPMLEFEDGDNSTERYIRDTWALLHSGYLKYTKRGMPFQMRNPADPDHPQVVLPAKYLSELKSAPESRFSFRLYSEQQAFLLNYSHAPKQTDGTTHIVRTEMNKNMGALLEATQEEIEVALASKLPNSTAWEPVTPYMALAYTTSRAIARVLGGRELSGSEEWIGMNVGVTGMTHQAAQQIREQYPPHLRWMARWRHPGVRAVVATRRRSAQIVDPIIRKRLAGAQDTKPREPDGIQWMLAAQGSRRPSAQEVADEQLFVGIASVHTTSATSLSILYDLLDRPNVAEEIIGEINAVAARHRDAGGRWTKQALSELEKLDSFMAESFRFNPVGLVTMQRSAVVDYVFQDGLRLPKHTQILFPACEFNRDGDVHPNPDVFDPWRFLKMRKAGDPNKHHFAYVSDQMMDDVGRAECRSPAVRSDTRPKQWPGVSAVIDLVSDQSCFAPPQKLIVVIGLCLLLCGSPPAAQGLATAADWKTLSNELSGRLHQGVPLARPCFSTYNGQPAAADEEECAAIRHRYLDAEFRANQYAGFHFAQGDGCISNTTNQCQIDPESLAANPGSGLPCNQGLVSPWYVDIRSASDVQSAFRFARRTGTPISIKASGHDYVNRNTLPGSLALWTRNLRNMTYHATFRPAAVSGAEPVQAITFGSGVNSNEAQAFAGHNNVTLVGPSSATIAIVGGWTLFGGHSVLSPTLGLGVDRVLQIEIVTPDGALRICNRQLHPDLFWALRGAGAGTYGLVLSMTVRVEPAAPVTLALLSFTPTLENQAPFLDLLINSTPAWSADGWGGPMTSSSLALVSLEQDEAAAVQSMRAAADYVLGENGTVTIEQFPTFSEFYARYIAVSEGDVGLGALPTLRVLPKRLHDQPQGRAELLAFLSQRARNNQTPYLFLTPPARYSNPRDNNDNNNGDSTSMHPAWRNSYWLAGFQSSYAWNASVAKRREAAREDQTSARDLTALAPDGAAYPNEASPWHRDWRREFWGDDNYARLQAVKARYDPAGLLRCWHCVGFDDAWVHADPAFECMGAFDGLV
ncbi:cytochrome P450 [Chaetomium tenue]|uniref:Cytochrome P450 n=1 Tax=Chaetomium tenue TaxID=1854479 RepID=A0ACB7PQ68_9PEZI|nr:cytochrome P450 [Chaetomium globosum]